MSPRPSNSSDRADVESGFRVSATLAGLLIGIALGFAGAFGGFEAFLIVLVVAAAGTVLGLIVDGRIDVSALIGRDRTDR